MDELRVLDELLEAGTLAQVRAKVEEIRGRAECGDLAIGLMPYEVFAQVPRLLERLYELGDRAAGRELAEWICVEDVGRTEGIWRELLALGESVELELAEHLWFLRREELDEVGRREAAELTRRVLDRQPGSARACYLRGLFMHAGWGVTRSDKGALELQEQASRLGSRDADFELHIFYTQGVGCEVDEGRAFAANLRAAEAGHPRAMYNMGVVHATGERGAVDMQAAVSWYERASEAGSGAASALLGLMYLLGDGVERDLACSDAFFGRALDLGVDIDGFCEGQGVDRYEVRYGEVLQES